MEFLEIDGSFGEGGGQILRTSVSLSCIMKKPIIIKNIRMNRKNPGLKPQHISALKILKRNCNAKFGQVKIGDTQLRFIPGPLQSLDLKEDVGTAGSISLIIQVLIPIMVNCKKKIKLTIIGGTDVLWSPSMDYSQIVLREAFSRMGINFSINIIKRGYYPKGGGIVELEVQPAKKIIPIVLKKRNTKILKLICSYSKIREKLIDNQIEHYKKKLLENNFSVEIQKKKETALDLGSSILIYSIDDDSIIGTDSLFDKKKKKFDLDLDKFICNKGGIDQNLADLLVLPASLADGMTVFQVDKISKHLETNLYVASKITGCRYGIGKLKDGYEIRIEGISYSRIK